MHLLLIFYLTDFRLGA